MGWLIVAIVVAALALALFGAERFLRTRVEPALDEVRSAAATARGVPVRAWTEPGATLPVEVAGERWLGLGAPHLLCAPRGTAAQVAADLLAADLQVLLLAEPGLDPGPALDAAGTRARAPGRLFTVGLPPVRWSVEACARSLPAGPAVVVVELDRGDPGDLMLQAARAAEARGCAVLLVADGPHVEALIAALGRLGHPGRVRTLSATGLAEGA